MIKGARISTRWVLHFVVCVNDKGVGSGGAVWGVVGKQEEKGGPWGRVGREQVGERRGWVEAMDGARETLLNHSERLWEHPCVRVCACTRVRVFIRTLSLLQEPSLSRAHIAEQQHKSTTDWLTVMVINLSVCLSKWCRTICRHLTKADFS